MINEIADKIKGLRKKRDLTLKDLSKKTGLSISFLSQVENNTSSLAITSLKKISEALNVPITYFFNNSKPHKFLVKKEEQSTFKLEGSDSKFIRLSGDFDKRTLESIVVIIPANQKHGDKSSHPGEEFIYVLKGTIIANLEDKDYIIKSGESIHFPASIPHILINPLDMNAEILTIVHPRIF